MKAPTLDELVLLAEPMALQRHFDAKNYRVFRWLVLFLGLLGLIGFISWIEEDKPAAAAVYAMDLLLGAGLFLMRKRPFFARNFRQILLTYLAVQIAMLKFTSTLVEGEDAIPLFIFATLLLLSFRLRFTEHLLLFGGFWIAAILPLEWLGFGAGAGLGNGGVAAVTTMSLICLAGSVGLTQLERRRFLAVWRREHTRSRERLRMREEIEYARKIQLSMLPQGPPETDWLDLAAASLPATEVGGDYYDYFRLAPARMALVIGDVAGHGLASGLLLSGVRSCLYLLEEDLADPVRVLDRLNHMVRRTTDKRTYITLICSLIDRAEGTLTLASAGHPPVLHWDSRARRFDTVGKGAPPLGTSLDVRFEEERRRIGSGDLLVFYTDGLIELRNGHGQDYGEERLRRAVARAVDRPAREIRDAVLGDLSNFKAGQEQDDDITVVIVRLR